MVCDGNEKMFQDKRERFCLPLTSSMTATSAVRPQLTSRVGQYFFYRSDDVVLEAGLAPCAEGEPEVGALKQRVSHSQLRRLMFLIVNERIVMTF